MSRLLHSCIGIALVSVGTFLGAGLEFLGPVASHSSDHREMLDRYCVTCHNQQARTAGLALNELDLENVGPGAEVWEKVLRKLESRAMPPAGMPRPSQAGYESLVAYLEGELDAAASSDPNPGRPVLHRLNRAEYTNAVRDLLTLQIDAAALLPPDDSGYGFDNIGDVLSVSPMLLERYLSAARRIARRAIGERAVRPDSRTYEVSTFLDQEDRVSEDLPFGSRGGIAVRHFFPMDGEYRFKVHLKTSYDGSIVLGVGEKHQIDFRLDRARIGTFTFGGGQYLSSSSALTGGVVPADQRDDPTDLEAPDAHLEVTIPVSAGPHLVGISFPREVWVPEQMIRPAPMRRQFVEPGVGRLTISGPYNPSGPGDTPSRQKVFSCQPASAQEEESCAREIISNLARRAYRRPILDEDLPSLLVPYHTGLREGGFEAGIELALQRILVSPEFLFRVERDPEDVQDGTPYPVSDLEFASRLSFFLWSSLPDEELLQLAETGRLKDAATLEQQVRRMLRDPRSRELIRNFAGQWLYLRNVATAAPDLGVFPEFDDNLRAALRQEAELFVESVLGEDGNVADLLDADYTFLNERLARHYGIDGVYGSHFRRVELTGVTERHGLLGKGSILTVTSYGNRTSPVLRGKWVLENILGAPPPPPPPNVPALEETGQDGKPRSMRARMEQHRANPACASCHARMDPLGFALENFDAIGGWRDKDGDALIDASGQLPDGTRFEGPAGLREVLLNRRQEFVRTLTEKLLTYALGRGAEYYDGPAVRSILREAAPDNYRWSSLILGIVRSQPFQMRRSSES